MTMPALGLDGFQRFATLNSADAGNITYTTTGLRIVYFDFLVPDEQTWVLSSASMYQSGMTSGRIGTGSLLLVLNVIRGNLNRRTSDVLDNAGRAQLVSDYLMHEQWIGTDTVPPLTRFNPGQPIMLPARTRLTLQAQVFGTTLPPEIPAVTIAPAIDVAIYARVDPTTGQPTDQFSPLRHEWWTT